MAHQYVKEVLDRIPTYAGEGGTRLARTIIETFAGVGRGISAKAVVTRLADEVVKENITVERGVWVYVNAKGKQSALGAYGDSLLPDIVGIATDLHKKPFARKGRPSIEPWELEHGILRSAQLVERELTKRKRIQRIRNFFRFLWT